MRLDRNINPDGTGKYALVHMRRLNLSSNGDHHNAFKELVEAGIISLGNESPGDQFFVMKHRDVFTPAALRAYAGAITLRYKAMMEDSGMLQRMQKILDGQQLSEAEKELGNTHHEAIKSLLEYRDQIAAEANKADKIAYQIPD